MRIAVIADIHGNMPALEAVLADIQRRNIDRTINLGNYVSGPLWPREVCDLLMTYNNLTTRGNHDRWVSGPDPRRVANVRFGPICPFVTGRGSPAIVRYTAVLSRCRPRHLRLSRHPNERQSVSRRGRVGTSAGASVSIDDPETVGRRSGSCGSVWTQPQTRPDSTAEQPADTEPRRRRLPIL
jgi:hypothetical protein